MCALYGRGGRREHPRCLGLKMRLSPQDVNARFFLVQSHFEIHRVRVFLNKLRHDATDWPAG